MKRGRKELEDHLEEKDEWLVHAFSLTTAHISTPILKQEFVVIISEMLCENILFVFFIR